MLLSLDGQVKAGRGNWAGAMDSYLDALQFGTEVPRGGRLDHWQVGRHIQLNARLNMEQTAIHLSASRLRAAIRRMEAIIGQHVPFSDVLAEAKWIVVAYYLEMFKDCNLLEALRWYENDNGVLRAERFGDRLPVLRHSKSGIIRNWTRYMDRRIGRVRRPYAARPPLPPAPRDPFNSLCYAILDGDEDWCSDLVNQTLNNELLATLALRAFKMEHGKYPAFLSELSPTYLSRVPDDLFSLKGKLKYRRTSSGYRLYSIGPDGRDDKGKPVVYHDAGHTAVRRDWISPASTGDIVAGIN